MAHPSSETYRILGVFTKINGKQHVCLAKGLLNKAISTYLKGFEADWRDAYPGVNALTLMELGDPTNLEKEKLVPVVTYAVKQRITHGEPDYWDFATLLELAILANDSKTATSVLGDVLAHIREPWEAETTSRNLRLIC